ncbi:metal ABC transporter permease [Phytopseudomonas punonensis]|uniref:Manganese/iron transport system permease protein n=1 Tax=Phytopseudomonas punonensis TaxID=1220495 RepID=A0A1M7GDB4_9GAMM|nr:metal ABC transporter permease [Pseudomonas punonensis]SHM14270.1 manganese/iron transport system permease protein [Pseudomonas punonensis]
MEMLLQPLQIDFMQYALLIAVLVAIPAALLSCFLVLKGWALMGDATAHAVFPGVVIAYIVGLPYSLGAFVAGMLCAVASGYLKENSRIKQDTLMGVVFSGMFGFGLLLYTQIHSDVHLDHILFGDMLGIGWADLLESGLIALAVTAFIGLKWRDLLLHAFDPVQARTVGLPVRVLHYGLLAVMSLTIVGALKAIGIVLTVALLIAPGAIAFLLTRTMGAMLFTAVSIAAGAALSGVYLSFFIDSAPGPTIVVLLSALFVVVFIYANRREHRSAAQL